MDEVFHSPQMAVRNMFPLAGGFPVTGPQVKFSETPGAVGSPAPGLGEHTMEALEELLGLPPEELASLAADGVISVGQGWR